MDSRVELSTDSRPISHKDILEMENYFLGCQDEGGGPDRAYRLLKALRQKYSAPLRDPLPEDNCVCANGCGDACSGFDKTYLQNMVSAGRRWMTIAAGRGGQALVWERKGPGCYSLRRGTYRLPKKRRRPAPDAAPKQGPEGVQGQIPLVPTALRYWRERLPRPEDERALTRAMDQLDLRTGPALLSALDTFTALGDRYPDFPAAPSLAVCAARHLLDYGHANRSAVERKLRLAIKKVRRADRECYPTLIAQGIHLYHNHAVRQAIRKFQEALRLYQPYPVAWKWLAECYMTLEDVPQAEQNIDTAKFYCDNQVPFLHGIHAFILSHGGKAEAERALRVLHDEAGGLRHPKNCVFGASAHLALALRAREEEQGDTVTHHLFEGEKLLQTAEALGEPSSLWLLTEKLGIYGLGRDVSGCREVGFEEKAGEVERLLLRCAQRTDYPGLLALQHAALSHEESALTALEQAVALRDPVAVHLATEPRFRRLRGEKRFQDLCKEVKARFEEAVVA
jgi:tetratricopeptide (TPR) repeat protein